MKKSEMKKNPQTFFYFKSKRNEGSVVWLQPHHRTVHDDVF